MAEPVGANHSGKSNKEIQINKIKNCNEQYDTHYITQKQRQIPSNARVTSVIS